MADDEGRLAEVLEQLKTGSSLVKQKFTGKRFSRQFFLHEREGFISYHKSRKVFGKPRTYHVKDIDEIRSGIRAPGFDRLVKRGIIASTDEQRVFSIMYDNHRKEEHFIAPDGTNRALWIQGLQHLMHRHAQKTQYHLIGEEKWILDFFHAADKNGSKTLTKGECRDLLENRLHVELPNHLFEQMFKKADKSNEGVLSSDEFINFFHLLTRRKDLYQIMKEFTNNDYTQTMDKVSMNQNELFAFLQQCAKAEQTQKFINEFEMNKELREKGRLSLDGFRNMLLSRNFDIIESFHSRQIYQDMTRPLCDYYINTSHNTYLFYSQISGDSNPEAYNRVLLMGCRAVELDCYDGDDGKPIVTHAYTLVKPCSFESIIRSIEPNLFKASPYPVILNIENHCSLEQQKQMAQILKTILGDRLVTKPLPNKDLSVLPSPDDLKHRVLIRDIESELAALFIYLQNAPYRENDYAKDHYSPFHSSSLAESRFYKLAETTPIDLLRQTTWRLLRLYPGGLRQDSSNVNPTHAWNFGIQMVALNYQNEDDMTTLSYGKFLDNGGCGYILKPNYLINAHQTGFNPWDPHMSLDNSQTLTITVISGQFLPRSHLKSSDIPDPYVRISTHGLSCDEYTQKTKVVNDNGFDPIWNETFHFRIKFPQMCLIYFSVLDYDVLSQDDRMAYFCSPVTMIQTGYRHIHLRANNGDQTHSTLFVHIDIQHDQESVISTRL